MPIRETNTEISVAQIVSIAMKTNLILSSTSPSAY